MASAARSQHRGLPWERVLQNVLLVRQGTSACTAAQVSNGCVAPAHAMSMGSAFTGACSASVVHTFGEAAAHPNALSGRWVEVIGWLPTTGTLSSNGNDL